MACQCAIRFRRFDIWRTLRLSAVVFAAAAFSFAQTTPTAIAGADEKSSVSAESKTTVTLNDDAVLPSHGSAAGVWAFLHSETGPQMLLLGHPEPASGSCYRVVLQLDDGDRVQLRFPVPRRRGSLQLRAVGLPIDASTSGEAVVRVGKPDATGEPLCQARMSSETVALFSPTIDGPASLSIEVVADAGPVALQLERIVWKTEAETLPICLDPVRRPWSLDPTACSPNMRPALVAALIEWDWRMQDGIGTPREPRTFVDAIRKRIPQIDKLADNLLGADVDLADLSERWGSLKAKIAAGPQDASGEWESYWREMHQIRRAMVLRNPLFDVGPLVFVKHVPSAMSHQLTQVYGYAARPGGGLFVLDEPGRSMSVRSLTEHHFPPGNFMHSEVSFDGKRIYFAFCEADRSPGRWRDPDTMDRHYHIYEMSVGGTMIERLTDGSFDHFNPTCLPNGKLMLVSTRRGGYHRCGGGPCYVYTLTVLDPTGSPDGGSLIYPVSFHETNEWDPSALNDGRILYTRWDYVDRDAVYYQNLWTIRPDGTDVRALLRQPHIFSHRNLGIPRRAWQQQSGCHCRSAPWHECRVGHPA